MKKLTTEQFILKAIKVHGDEYDYSKTNYIGRDKEISYRCKVHGEISQLAGNHLSGKGCKHCSGNTKSITEEFIQKARIIHGSTYDYSGVAYETAKIKVKIVCSEHGGFLQSPNAHLAGKGCKFCAGTAKLNTNDFIAKAKAIHKSKYDYSKTDYVLSHLPVIIICERHGEFSQTPNAHLVECGCPKCGNASIGDKLRDSLSDFLEKARTIHGDRYDYSKVKYSTANRKVIISCPIHGEFLQTPNKHISRKSGCPSCTEYGYNTSKPAIFYLIEINENILGFGISNSFDDRYRTHRKNFKKHSVIHELLQTFNCTGHQALAIENHLKQTYEIIDTGIEGFRKEATEIKYLPDILKYIKKLLDTI